MTFGAGKNTFGKDEAQDIIYTQGGYVPDAFTLFVEGFSKNSFLSLGISVGAFGGSFAGLSGITISASPLGVKYESGVPDAAPRWSGPSNGGTWWGVSKSVSR